MDVTQRRRNYFIKTLEAKNWSEAKYFFKNVQFCKGHSAIKWSRPLHHHHRYHHTRRQSDLTHPTILPPQDVPLPVHLRQVGEARRHGGPRLLLQQELGRDQWRGQYFHFICLPSVFNSCKCCFATILIKWNKRPVYYVCLCLSKVSSSVRLHCPNTRHRQFVPLT